jgi:site-specific recombinase XerD
MSSAFLPSAPVFTQKPDQASAQAFSWDEALHEFRLHLRATRAPKTLHYYDVQLGRLVRWATQNDVPFAGFGKRHMDRYLVERAEAGKAQLTLHHDAVCAKAFFRWCQRNDVYNGPKKLDSEMV